MLKRLQPGKDKPYLTESQKHAARRVGDLARIYRDQYPNGLPHNDVGVKYSKYICRTMAFLPKDRRPRWLDRYAPWMNAEIRDSILSLGPYWYSARSLGNHLEVDNEDRERLQVWTVEAFDINEEQRRMINLEKDRQAQERRRRNNGAKPQAESLSRLKPWESLNMSRAKFYRLPKETRDALVADLTATKARETTSSAPSLYNSTNDEPVSQSALAASNPFSNLVFIVPTPEQMVQMAELQRGYACEAVPGSANTNSLYIYQWPGPIAPVYRLLAGSACRAKLLIYKCFLLRTLQRSAFVP